MLLSKRVRPSEGISPKYGHESKNEKEQTESQTMDSKSLILIFVAWIVLATCVSPVGATAEENAAQMAAIAAMDDKPHEIPDDYFNTDQIRHEGAQVGWSCEFVNEDMRIQYFSGNNYLHIKEYPLAVSHEWYARNMLKRYLYTIAPEEYRTWVDPATNDVHETVTV